MHHLPLISKPSAFHRSFCATVIKPAEEFADLCFRGHVKEAFQKFNSEIWSHNLLFPYLLQGCIVAQSLPLARQLHSISVISGFSSYRYVSNHLINMYCKLGEMSTAVAVFDHIQWKNIMSCNILIGGYVLNGNLITARRLFDEMRERNLATWNAMIAGYMQFEFNEEGIHLFSEMHELGYYPDAFTLGSVLRGCAGLRCLDSGRQIHAHVFKRAYEFHLIVGSSLAHMYMKSGSLKDGERIVRMMKNINVVAFNTLIAGKSQNGFSEEALMLYSMMKSTGLKPDKITFVSVISSCSELATIFLGQQIHAESIKSSAHLVASVVSSLVSMYSKCGCLEESLRAFEEGEKSDAVTWSSMIAAYGFHGKGEKAVQLFERMEREEMEISVVTFLSLLHACSHCRMKDKGLELFNLMIKKYLMKPQIKHYTCIVDLLGRCGHLEEAEYMIRSMRVNPDAIIWKTLLSACQMHKNVDMAKNVASEIIKLDSHDPAAYVLLHNTHASLRSWSDAMDVRKAMRDLSVQKEPGVSWLEVKNEIHLFTRGCMSHPRFREIDLCLVQLIEEMKLCGYVPDDDGDEV